MERNPDDPEDGRTRRRLGAMRRIQAAALDLFEREGFDAVTIDRIAQAAEVGPATVYRNFGSKERIVLWDDYDPELLQAIERRLATAPPLRAFRDAVVARLDEVFARDKRRILRRTRLLLEHPQIAALALSDQAALRDALAALLEPRTPTRLVANVIAAALVSALSVAVTTWAVERAKRPLADVLDEAFAALAAL